MVVDADYAITVSPNGTFSDYIDASSHNTYQIGDCGDKAPPPPPAVCTPAAVPLGCFNVSGLWCFNKTRTNAGWRHDPNRGCILGKGSPGDLTKDLSLERCAAQCAQWQRKDKASTLFGVTNGEGCFCGDPDSLALASAKSRARPAAECSAVPCRGAVTEKCGGFERLSVYSYNVTATASPWLPHKSDNDDNVARAIFRYSGGVLNISLVGAGDAARVVYVPSGANPNFLRYQGYINQSALELAAATFAKTSVGSQDGYTVLARPGWALNVSHAEPMAQLVVNGVIVSADVAPPTRVMGAACDPPGWSGLAAKCKPGEMKGCVNKGTVAGTVAQDKGGCLRATRSLSVNKKPAGAICCSSYDDPVGAKKAGGQTTPCDLKCPVHGQKISAITFSEYGTPLGDCGDFKMNPACDATNHSTSIRAVATSACVGKSACKVTRQAAEGKISWGDPCWGNPEKRLVMQAICSGGPPPPPLPGPPPVTQVKTEQIYGFGQTVTPGLSAVGSTKFIATSSLTSDRGPSHAPAPFYISLANASTHGAESVAHGFMLNSHGFSAFDIGKSSQGEMLVSSPDPVLDYFLFAGPTPAKVLEQYTALTGRLSLPPKWSLGMKVSFAKRVVPTASVAVFQLRQLAALVGVLSHSDCNRSTITTMPSRARHLTSSSQRHLPRTASLKTA